MEDYFNPGFKTNGVFVGSQTASFFQGLPEEQAWEGFYFPLDDKKNVVVVRNIEQSYLSYWNLLMGNSYVVNIIDKNGSKYLTSIILENRSIINDIKSKMKNDARLMVFLPTKLEEKLANVLGIPLHGSVKINSRFGTKDGIRTLALQNRIPMAPGFICTTRKQVEDAIYELSRKFTRIVIKHSQSVSGYLSKAMKVSDSNMLAEILDEVVGSKLINGKKFIDNHDTVIVEGWVKGKASLCAHIEILQNGDAVVCSGWQQVIDNDGISYMGSKPLSLSNSAMTSFISQVNTIAHALKQKGAIGSFGPDFLITADDEVNIKPDTSILIELNARVPYTAVALELVKKVRGKIGNGFYSKHIHIRRGRASFLEIMKELSDKKLLITSKDKSAKGIVPYNVGLLRWGIFDTVAMADTAEEAKKIIGQVDSIFS